MLNIVAVSYTNTLPFIYGIKNSGFLSDYNLTLKPPSECVKELLSANYDIGLIPTGALSDFKQYNIISNHCIGAIRDVKTVLLVSNDPLDKIENIYLDDHSRTSVNLCKVLCKNFWKISPSFKSLTYKKDDFILEKNEAAILIGDKTFSLENKYKYTLDLATEWNKFTKLPFVFAVWISLKKLDKKCLIDFNNSLKFGIDNIDKLIENSNDLTISKSRAYDYFKKDISYDFTNEKKEAMNIFLKLKESI